MKHVKLLFVIICLVSITMGCSFLGSNEAVDQEVLEDLGDQQLSVLIGAYTDPLNTELIQILRKAIIQFELDHPAVKVTLDTSTPSLSLDDKIFSTDENIEVPDIILVASNKLNKYADNDILADLSTYAVNDNLSMSDFYKPLLEKSSRDGEWLTMPFAPDTQVVYYNKDWFDLANLPYPGPDWTWEDFAKTAQLLKESRPAAVNKTYGGMIFPTLYTMEPMILSQGGSILSSDGRGATGYLDSDASVKAVQIMNDFIRNQDLIDEVTRPTDYYYNYLIRERTGMIVSSASLLFYLQSEFDSKLGVASLPKAEGGVRANPILTSGLSIMEQSNNKQLAWELLKMITLDQNEFTQQWSQWFLVNNMPLAKSTGQDVDPFKAIMLDELNYIQKSAFEQNEHYTTVFRSDSKIYEMINKLIALQGAAEIQAQLTLIAQFIDEDMKISEATEALKQQEKP